MNTGIYQFIKENNPFNGIYDNTRTLFNHCSIKTEGLIRRGTESAYLVYDNFSLLASFTKNLRARTIDTGLTSCWQVFKTVHSIMVYYTFNIDIIEVPLLFFEKISESKNQWLTFKFVLKSLLYHPSLVLKILCLDTDTRDKIITSNRYDAFQILTKLDDIHLYACLYLAGFPLSLFIKEDEVDYSSFVEKYKADDSLVGFEGIKYPLLLTVRSNITSQQRIVEVLYYLNKYPSLYKLPDHVWSQIVLSLSLSDSLERNRRVFKVLEYLAQHPDLYVGIDKLPDQAWRKILSLSNPMSVLAICYHINLRQGLNDLENNLLLKLIDHPDFLFLWTWLPLFKFKEEIINEILESKNSFKLPWLKFIFHQTDADYKDKQFKQHNKGSQELFLNIENLCDDNDIELEKLYKKETKYILNEQLKKTLKEQKLNKIKGDLREANTSIKIPVDLILCGRIQDIMSPIESQFDSTIEISASIDAKNINMLTINPNYRANVIVNMFKLDQINAMAKKIDKNPSTQTDTYIKYIILFKNHLKLSQNYDFSKLYDHFNFYPSMFDLYAFCKLIKTFTKEKLIEYASNLRAFTRLFESEAKSKFNQLMINIDPMNELSTEARKQMVDYIKIFPIELIETTIQDILNNPKSIDSAKLKQTLCTNRDRIMNSFYRAKAIELFLKAGFLSKEPQRTLPEDFGEHLKSSI